MAHSTMTQAWSECSMGSSPTSSDYGLLRLKKRGPLIKSIRMIKCHQKLFNVEDCAVYQFRE